MTSEPFNDGWTFRRHHDSDARPVRLPHDAMIHEIRSPQGSTGHHGGFFPGGRYLYARTFTGAGDASVGTPRLRFEGVYGATVIRLNGVEVGRNDSGYREFTVDLATAYRPGEDNHLEVEVDNSATPNGRWYTGSGIYRRVWLEHLPPARFSDDGIRVHTRTLGAEATVDVRVDVEGAAPGTTVQVQLADAGDVVAHASGPIDTTATLTLTVPAVRPWSHEDPHLYTATVELHRDGVQLDARELRVGLRTIAFTPGAGLLVNGAPVLLQGGAVHHDHGVLGAATFRAAEFRRARIMKDNGFNAIRSAHQPASRDLLDAADHVGLYVVDELSDVWHHPKTPHDASATFAAGWRDDARAMVAKARNHPSVIMYSVGNEVGETALPEGVATTRTVSSFVRDLDPHRPTTLAMNFLVNLMTSRGTDLFRANDAPQPAAAEQKRSAASSTVANIAMNKIGSIMQLVARLPIADKVSRDALAEVEVAGYNYAWSRYDADAKNHPDRLVYGSETLPGDIAKAWARVERLPTVIGDFLWTGWDYIGETGLGTWTYGAAGGAQLSKVYPHVLAGCGVIDLIGMPGAGMLLARAAWGELTAPGITVRPVDRAGQRTHRVAWRASDAVPSWAWSGCSGNRAEIEVYSADDEVELFLDGTSLGRKATGRDHGFLARFRVPYRAGTLEAIGRRGGREVSRSTLCSAGAVALHLVPETDSVGDDGQDLAFVQIQLADGDGTVEMLADDTVTVTVTGAGELAGLGSAAPSTTDSWTGTTVHTHHGRALAVIRSTGGTGPVTITATSTAHGTATATVTAAPVAPREGVAR